MKMVLMRIKQMCKSKHELKKEKFRMANLDTPNSCGHGGFKTIDHIIPLDKGGLDNELNYQFLCEECNGLKSNKVNYECVSVVYTNELFRFVVKQMIVDEKRNNRYYRDVLSSLFGTDDFLEKKFTIFSENLLDWIYDYLGVYKVYCKTKKLNGSLYVNAVAKPNDLMCFNVLNPDFKSIYDINRLVSEVF